MYVVFKKIWNFAFSFAQRGQVHPGDVVVADGDGVIVVPRKMAVDVAKYAHQELANDKVGRRKIYEAMGMELDNTVL